MSWPLRITLHLHNLFLSSSSVISVEPPTSICSMISISLILQETPLTSTDDVLSALQHRLMSNDEPTTAGSHQSPLSAHLSLLIINMWVESTPTSSQHPRATSIDRCCFQYSLPWIHNMPVNGHTKLLPNLETP